MKLARIAVLAASTAVLFACTVTSGELTRETEQGASVNGQPDCFTECKQRIEPTRANCQQLVLSMRYFSLYRPEKRINESNAGDKGWGTTPIVSGDLPTINIGFNHHVDGCSGTPARGKGRFRFFLPYCEDVVSLKGGADSKWYEILEKMYQKYLEDPSKYPLPRGFPSKFMQLIALSCWNPCKNQLLVECLVKQPDVMPPYKIVTSQDEASQDKTSWTYKEMCLFTQLGGTWPKTVGDISTRSFAFNLTEAGVAPEADSGNVPDAAVGAEVPVEPADAGEGDGGLCCSTCDEHEHYKPRGPINDSDLPPELVELLQDPATRALFDSVMNGSADPSFDSPSTPDSGVLAPTTPPPSTLDAGAVPMTNPNVLIAPDAGP